MATDGRQPSDNIAMIAVLAKAVAKANARGVKSYKVAFTYPRGFLGVLDEILGMTADVYWNDVLVANSAHLIGMHQHPQPEADPLYVVELDLDASDTSLANLADEVNQSGTVRFHVTQMALFGSDQR